jgi:hypothetical protein
MQAVITTVVMAVFAFGCQSRDGAVVDAAPAALPEITSIGENFEGAFEDLVFAAQSVEQTEDRLTVTAVGVHNSREVAFRAVVAKGMIPGVTASGLNREAFKESGVVLERVDARSDAFMSVLAELYGAEENGGEMGARTKWVAFPLEGNPANLATTHVSFKLFCESEREEDYAELFLHLDIPNHRVELHEKDPGYREGVLSCLRRGSDA